MPFIIRGMPHLDLTDLEQIGLTVARRIVGHSVDAVEVVSGVDHTELPAYFITYRFDNDSDRAKASLCLIRLSQALRDELIHRGDDRYPFVRLLAPDDWGHRGDAGPN